MAVTSRRQFIAGTLFSGVGLWGCSGRKDDSLETQILSFEDDLVRVEFSRATVTIPKVVSNRNRPTTSSKDSRVMPLLHVYLSVTNITESKKIDYTGWSKLPPDGATLIDNLGNKYTNQGRSLSIAGRLIGEDTGSIYPGKMREDVIVFEVPVEAATMLQLTLPAAAYTTGITAKTANKLRIKTEAVVR